MSLFKKDTPATSATQQPVPSSTMQLTKGGSMKLTKTGAPIKAVNGWTAQRKDYDLKGLIRYRDGRLLYIGAANADESLRSLEGAVSHSGDSRSADELETISIRWNPQIASVALSSYSALENGAGSFKEYGVYVEIQNGSQVVRISAADASANRNSYTLCFGEIIFENDGSLTVVNHELYSAANSENRVGYQGDRVVMDIGPRGQNK